MAAGSRGKEDSVTKKGRPGKAEKEGTPVLLTITGRQTDPDTGTQENTASYRAVMSACGEGHLFSYLYVYWCRVYKSGIHVPHAL